MFSFLKNHPFAVEAFFERSIVLTFAFPKEDLQPLIPNCLVLDTFENHYAFVAVAMEARKTYAQKGFLNLWEMIFSSLATAFLSITTPIPENATVDFTS